MDVVLEKILTNFDKISAIPRCSKSEAAIGKWLCDWAAAAQLEYERDVAGNIVIRLPASAGYENSQSVVLQGHMDMVCEKIPSSKHNFTRDGIVTIREGDWLRADGTTLGADNGVAIVLAMAIVEEGIPHPPLELLFTVDEETGLTGAGFLEPGFLRSRRLINLDSEGEGAFTVGCAGGRDAIISLPLEYDAASDNSEFLKITVSGSRGGHSGADIHKNHANAIKILARLLYNLKSEFSFNLISIQGGQAHNAIARDASATICIFPEELEAISDNINQLTDIIQQEFRTQDPELTIHLSNTEKPHEMVTEIDTFRAISLLMALPHGLTAMSPDIPGLVETSNNLAVIGIENKSLNMLISIRSSVASRIDALAARISSIAELAGAEVTTSDGYPAWEADISSQLLLTSQKVYSALFGKEANVLTIHAGLECGVIGKIFPDMEMISFGPTIKNAHSPDEKLFLPSLSRTWEFLVQLLAALK
ncbi:MAG: aminoacyl-histidine dipeptidase [Candidatus Cloacimonetes bacterium]|nr:aminoacyl-histidine dipeptidase [Candidatus Cloacimonadota bacterium]